MNSNRFLPTAVLVASTVLLVSCDAIPYMPAPEHDYGIVVDQAKLYDDQTLRLQLNLLQAQLGKLTAIDPSIATRLGNVQGATSQQSSFGAQLSVGSSPGVGTVATAAMPSVATTLTGVASSGLAPAYPASSSQTTTANGNSLQTTTTTAAMNPTIPTLPAAIAPSMSATFGLSPEDVLAQAIDLGNQIANLQLLLQGSVADEYTSDGFGKRHITLGFPVSITTPPDRRYQGLLAEVEVRICGFAETVGAPESPSLMTILPREKTYNINTVTQDVKSVGAGAVISGIVNVGANFLGVKQTSYLVQAQDTIALKRKAAKEESCNPDPKAAAGDAGSAAPTTTGKLQPLVFSWQFRPVLNRETIQQGMRQMFAQIALPDHQRDLPLRVQIRKFWRRYDGATGIAHDPVAGDVDSPRDPVEYQEVQVNFNTLGVGLVVPQANVDGTITTRLEGHFLSGTSVRIGGSVLSDGSPGFYNSGHFVAFTVPAQTLALALASAPPEGRGVMHAVVLRDPMGGEAPIEISGPDAVELNPVANALDGNVSLTVRSAVPVTAVVSGADRPTKIQTGSYSSETRTLALRDVLISDLPKLNFLDQKGVAHPELKTQIPFIAPAASYPVQTRVEVFGHFDSASIPQLAGKYGGKPGGPWSIVYDVDGSVSPADLYLKTGKDACPVKLSMTDAKAEPHGATQYLVSVALSQCSAIGPPIGTKPIRYVVFAGKVYGGPDAPFVNDQATKLSWLVPASAVQVHQTIRLRQIFLGDGYSADAELEPALVTQVDGVKLKFSGKVNTGKVKNGKPILESGVVLAVTGSGLTEVQFYGQSHTVPISVIDRHDDSYVELFLEDTKGLKQITVERNGLAPQMMEMPTLSADASPKSDTKPKFDKADPVTQNSTGQYVIKGSNLSDVALVRYQKEELSIFLSPKGDSIQIEGLPADLTAKIGIRPLLVVFGDKTTKTFGIPVVALKK